MRNNQRVLSVVVTYNGSKWVEQCFGSLLNSSLSCDIIAIDNGSTDDTTDLIRNKYPEVFLHISSENLGFGKANNIGLKRAIDEGYEYVFLLNQDAWVERDTIERLVYKASESGEFDLFSPLHLTGKGDALDNNFSKYISPASCPGLISDAMLCSIHDKCYEIQFVNAAAWLLSRKAILGVGGFHPLFDMYGEDVNYIQRMHFHGLKACVFPLCRVWHDRDQRTPPKYHVEDERIMRRNLLVEYAGPGKEAQFIAHKRIVKRARLKAILTSNRTMVKYFSSKLELINTLEDEMKQYRILSEKTASSAFLQ